MRVDVKLFARARDLAGADMVSVEVPDQATVGGLRRQLALAYPTLKTLIERSALAVHDEFAGDATVLLANAEVALLPPVSGG
ncbi:MAG TPA: MoaD/ThiS family protein [Gemmataceae bacterium]|nr:MoaD/ThiS family protein [Gemmataceae bacterium]